MKVFEYVIVHRPEDEGKKPYIVNDEIGVILAANRDQVLIEAAVNVPGDISLDEVEIIVRPFV